MTIDISQVQNTLEQLQGTGASGQTAKEEPFSQAFGEIFDETAKNLQRADQAVLQANSGGEVDLHEMMIAMEKADVSLRLLVQVRNKAVKAYKEIMRMQV